MFDSGLLGSITVSEIYALEGIWKTVASQLRMNQEDRHAGHAWRGLSTRGILASRLPLRLENPHIHKACVMVKL